MNDWVQFESFYWWTLGIVVLGWIILLSLEIKKRPTKFLWVRLTGITLMTLGVAGLLFRPGLPVEHAVEEIVLIGEKTPASQLDSLRRALPEALFISHDTLNTDIQASEILVTGYGLPMEDLWKIEENQVRFLPAILSNTIVRFNADQQAIRGDTLLVSGEYAGDSSWIRLRWNGQTMDSVQTDLSGKFMLRDIPQVAGPRLYSMEVQGEDTVQAYPWAIDISETTPKRIGIFLSFPSFEVRALKEYLGANGLTVLLRQSISRDKFSYEYLNTDERESMSWTDEFLSSLDILLLDQGFMENLSQSQFGRLEKALREGLGLILFPDGSSAGRGALTLDVSERDGDFFLQPTPLLETVHRENNRIIAGGKYVGQGRLMVSLNPTTYRWPLEGNSRQYETYWGALVRAAIRKPGSDRIQTTWPPRVDSPVMIEGASGGIPKIQWENHPIAPKQDIYFPFRWTSDFWPDTSGWQKVIFDSDTSRVFVYAQDDWEGIRFQQQQRAIRQLEGKTTATVPLTEGFEPMSRWVFLILFLLGYSIVWAEPKLFA